MNNQEVRVRTEDEKFEMVTNMLNIGIKVPCIVMAVTMVLYAIFG